MFISENHFLLPHVQVVVDGKIHHRITGVDTQLMVGTRIVGYDPEHGVPIIDLVKVDRILIDLGTMPEGLFEMLPDWFFHTSNIQLINSRQEPPAEPTSDTGVESNAEDESKS